MLGAGSYHPAPSKTIPMDSTPAPIRRRRLWPWILAILLAPVLFAAVLAASILTLNRDAAALRRDVMAATQTGWNTKVQLSLGRVSFWALRQCLAFVPDHQDKIGEARAALQAVSAVSVGVYQPTDRSATWSRTELFNETDRTMRERGWTRLVGVAEKLQNVLIYVPTDGADFSQVCLAVVTGRELVVVSATLDPDALAELVALHAGKHLPRSLIPLKV